MERRDPIGERYYKPLRRAEVFQGWLFPIGAVLSILILVVEERDLNGILVILFVVSVIAHFIAGTALRLYLNPRAEEQRRLDLLSNSYNVSLTHENAVGYFNNDAKNPLLRLGLSVMESSFFSSRIVGEMLFVERLKISLYFLVWILLALTRSIDLSWIVIATQAIFSEEVISRWLRMEWFSSRCKAVNMKLHRLFTTAQGLNNTRCHAQVLENFAEYEAVKSRASIAVSERIFEKRNPELSKEWETIKATLGVR